MKSAKWIGAVLAIFVSLGAVHAQDPLFMADKMNGWKMEYMGGVAALLRTADGGKHWMGVSPPMLAAAARSQDAFDLEERTAICLLDAQRAWLAVTLKDRVMLEFTSSGGQHWSESMGPPAMNSVNISFLDEHTGYLLISSDPAAGHMLKEVYGTRDGGRQWTHLTSPNLQGMKFYTTGIAFRSPQVGWVTGTYHGEPDAPLFRTEDGGKTWSVQKLEFPPDYQGGYANVDPPLFIGAGKMHGYLPVTLVRQEPPPTHRAWVNYETDDGGATWHLPASGVQSTPDVSQDYTYGVPVVLEGYVTEEPAVENLGEPWPEGEKPRKASTIFVLVLKKPITVIGNPADPINTETETNVSRLQMIDSGPGDVAAWEARLENHVKQRDLIVINGSLLHAHTVHHKTPVLLLPTSFRPANAPDTQQKPRNTSLRTLPLAGDPVSYGKMVVVAEYPARPDLDYVRDRISKLLSDNKIFLSGFPQGAGVSVNVPASQSKKALGILADAVLKEHLPIELVGPNEAGDRYITIAPESARKLSGESR